MPQASRFVLWLFVALFMALGLATANAAQRKITLMPGNDLPGGDYSVVKGITLNACETACSGDNLCHAFTFNQKAGWCFLKSVAGTPAPFVGATSGKVDSMGLDPGLVRLHDRRAWPAPLYEGRTGWRDWPG